MQKTDEMLPRKVELMYQAVVEMICEGSDVNTMKVQDITKRAGIGKGTAYEYFKSKEELIGKAIDWNFQSFLSDIYKNVYKKTNFKDKIFCLLDQLYEKQLIQKKLFQVLGTSSDSCCFSEAMRVHMQECQYPQMILQFLENITDFGIKEGALSADISHYNRRTALISQISMYVMYMNRENYPEEEEKEDIKEIVYRNILVLNQ